MRKHEEHLKCPPDGKRRNELTAKQRRLGRLLEVSLVVVGPGAQRGSEELREETHPDVEV